MNIKIYKKSNHRKRWQKSFITYDHMNKNIKQYYEVSFTQRKNDTAKAFYYICTHYTKKNIVDVFQVCSNLFYMINRMIFDCLLF